jgi:hypothetical protein
VNEHNVTLESGGDSYPGRLNAPEGSTDSGVLVLPGGGHGPFGDVFDRVATTAGDAGHAVARFETWTGPDDLDAKTDADLAAEIDAGVDFLRSEGCSTITVVAKSFGGRLALEHAPDVDRMVLWAPAVFFGEREDRPSIDAAADSEGPPADSGGEPATDPSPVAPRAAGAAAAIRSAKTTISRPLLPLLPPLTPSGTPASVIRLMDETRPSERLTLD